MVDMREALQGLILLLRAGIIAVVFAPAWAWEWVLGRSAQQEGKSPAEFTREARKDLHHWLFHLSEGAAD